MSVRITLQILGSICGTGTVTTGLVLGLPKLKTAFDSGVSDVMPVKSTDEIEDVVAVEKSTDEVTDVQSSDEITHTPIDIESTETNTVIDKKEQKDSLEVKEIQATETITPPLVVSDLKKSTSNRKPGTHIQKIESYKWNDEEVVIDWTAVTPQEGDKKSILYFLAEVKNYQENNIKHPVTEFLLTSQEKTIMKIWCDGDQSIFCFPMYEFSDNPQNLDNLDLTKLVQIYNQGWSGEDSDPVITWTQKYIVFAVDHEKIKNRMINDLHAFNEGYSKLSEWKKIYDKNKSFSNTSLEGGNQKNTLSLKISYRDEREAWEPELEIINFLTPSFKLPKIDVVDEVGEEEDTEDAETNNAAE